MLLVLALAPRSFFPGTQVFPSLQNQHLQMAITRGSLHVVDEVPLLKWMCYLYRKSLLVINYLLVCQDSFYGNKFF